MTHEMLTGDDLLVTHGEVRLAPTLAPTSAAIISELTCTRREDRLGFGPDGAAAVCAHVYFAGLDFEEVLHCERGPLSSLAPLDRLTCDLSDTLSSTGTGTSSHDSGEAGPKPRRRARSPRHPSISLVRGGQ
jgi:hypothetical protein